jgi:hypothetical protein
LRAGTCRAPIGAVAAPAAYGRVDDGLPVNLRNGPQLAVIHTLEAANAPVFSKQQFRLGGLALRTVAPRASQRASLEEHRRADPWAVVGRTPLDSEDITGHKTRVSCRKLGVGRAQ